MCTCVRSGYGLICAALSTGPTAVSSHIAGFFRLWQASAKHAEEGTRHFNESHDLSCLDAMLVSFVSFLKNCSELLLSVPDALNRSTLLLENVFPLVSSGGRLGEESANPAVASRLDSAKASILEAFAWLPPGSYAFAADQVFSFAALHIQVSNSLVLATYVLRFFLVVNENNFGEAENDSHILFHHPIRIFNRN